VVVIGGAYPEGRKPHVRHETARVHNASAASRLFMANAAGALQPERIWRIGLVKKVAKYR
jgi:hypothetical protein